MRYEDKQEFLEDLSKGKLIQADCEKCAGEKEHTVISSYTDKGSQTIKDEGFGVWWENEYQIIQCRGCKTISFRVKKYFSEDDNDDASDPTKIYLYPKRSWNNKQHIAMNKLPKSVATIYSEIIKAYNNDCTVLCVIGIRALVEAVCKTLNIEGQYVPNKNEELILKKDLEAKINGLVDKQYLAPHVAKILHTHRFMGNEAAHEIQQFQKKDLLTAIEILEHCLEHFYIVPYKSQSLPIIERKK